MSDMYRTRTMDQISEGDIGAQLKIAGWVENIRDHGGVSFIDLRDMYGVMQVVLRDTSLLDHVRKRRMFICRRCDPAQRRRNILTLRFLQERLIRSTQDRYLRKSIQRSSIRDRNK